MVEIIEVLCYGMVINVNSVSINKNVDTVLTLNLHHTSDSVFPIHLFKRSQLHCALIH